MTVVSSTASAARINHSTLFATTRCGIGDVVEFSTRKGVPVKEIAERHLIGALGFVSAVVDLGRLFKTEPGVRASRIRRMSFYHNCISVPRSSIVADYFASNYWFR